MDLVNLGRIVLMFAALGLAVMLASLVISRIQAQI